MSIKALLLDDEPLALRQLEMYAAKVPDMEVVGGCHSASAAMSHVQQADVLFADIQMPDISGLDFVRSLQKPPLVVFTTAFAEYALEGFRVNAVGYLLKPFSLDEFCKVTDKVRHLLELERRAVEPVSADVLHFKADYKNITVPLNSIRYVESMSEYIKIWLDDNPAPVLILYSMKRLIEQLPASRFVRIHRTYIIPIARVTQSTATSVTLSDGITLPIGDTYRQAFRAMLQNSKGVR